MNHKTDRELLKAYLAKDENSFHALVERHGPMVYGVAYRILKNKTDSEDVSQAVFLTLAERAATLRNADSLPGWLYHVAYRAAIDWKRSESVRKKREREAEAMKRKIEEERRAKEAELSALYETIDILPERHRTPLLLACLQGHSHSEASEIMGINESSFNMRLSRARDYLKKKLMRRHLALPAALLLLQGEKAACAELFTSALAQTISAASTSGLAATSTAAATTSTALSAKALQIAQTTKKMLLWAKLKTATTAACVTVAAAAGTTTVYTTTTAQPPKATDKPAAVAAKQPEPAPAPKEDPVLPRPKPEDITDLTIREIPWIPDGEPATAFFKRPNFLCIKSKSLETKDNGKERIVIFHNSKSYVRMDSLTAQTQMELERSMKFACNPLKVFQILLNDGLEMSYFANESDSKTAVYQFTTPKPENYQLAKTFMDVKSGRLKKTSTFYGYAEESIELSYENIPVGKFEIQIPEGYREHPRIITDPEKSTNEAEPLNRIKDIIDLPGINLHSSSIDYCFHGNLENSWHKYPNLQHKVEYPFYPYKEEHINNNEEQVNVRTTRVINRTDRTSETSQEVWRSSPSVQWGEYSDITSIITNSFGNYHKLLSLKAGAATTIKADTEYLHMKLDDDKETVVWAAFNRRNKLPLYIISIGNEFTETSLYEYRTPPVGTFEIPEKYKNATSKNVSVSGRVVDMYGAPVPGANVELWYSNQNISTKADNGGNFRLLIDGRYFLAKSSEIRLRATSRKFADMVAFGLIKIRDANDYAPNTKLLEAQIRYSDKQDNIAQIGDLRLQMEPADTISGRVVDGMGKPVSNAFLQNRIFSTSEEAAINTALQDKNRLMRTDKDGYFTMRNIPHFLPYFSIPPENRIKALKAGYASTVKFLDSGKDKFNYNCEIVMYKNNVTVYGRVINNQGEPLRGYKVTANYPGRDVFDINTCTDNNGNYQLAGVPVHEHVQIQFSTDGRQFPGIRSGGKAVISGYWDDFNETYYSAETKTISTVGAEKKFQVDFVRPKSHATVIFNYLYIEDGETKPLTDCLAVLEIPGANELVRQHYFSTFFDEKGRATLKNVPSLKEYKLKLHLQPDNSKRFTKEQNEAAARARKKYAGYKVKQEPSISFDQPLDIASNGIAAFPKVIFLMTKDGKEIHQAPLDGTEVF